MTRSRARRIAMSVAFLCSLLFGGHSPAHAATQNLIYDCSSSIPVTLIVSPGDVLSFTSNCGPAPGATQVNTQLFTSYPASFSGWPQVFVVKPSLAQGGYSAAFKMFGAQYTTYSLQYGVNAVPSALADVFPPDWMQSYGRLEGAACLDGWNPSWARWPNGGTGSHVCNRTLGWSGSSWITR
jgi:hypothetical protein